MHINEFHANEVDMICDGNHRHMPLMHTEGKPRRPLSWVDTVFPLVLRRDGRVRYGMMGMSRDVSICSLKYMHCYANLEEKITTS